MACIIKIKEGNQYKAFDTIEEAKQYIKDNNVVISEIDTKDGKTSFLEVRDQQAATIEIIRSANNESWEATKDLLTRTKLNGWDTEEYLRNSDALSLSDCLKRLTVRKANGEVTRLFPEFITGNYLNTLIQNTIVKEYLNYKNENSNNDLVVSEARKKFFDDTLPENERSNGVLRTAEDWYNYFKTQVKDDGFVLGDDVLASYDQDAQDINNLNFDLMLRGEVMHHILEMCIKGSVTEANLAAKDKIWRSINEKLLEDFKKKYGEDYKDVPQSLQAIQDLISGKTSENAEVKSLVRLFDNYFVGVLKAKKLAEDTLLAPYRDRGESPKYQWLSEQRITSTLDDEVEGKTKVRGKIDAILVIDGVPHIIDLKVSKNDIDRWPSEKKLKTKYQLAMYWRMLGRLGLPVSESTINVVGITLSQDKTVKNVEFKSFSADVKGSNQINENLDTFLTQAPSDVKVDIEQVNQVKQQIEDVFGPGSAKGQRAANEEAIKERLKQNIIKKGDQYYFTYFILDDNGVKSVRKESDKVKKVEDLEPIIEKVAKEIVAKDAQKTKTWYKKFVADIEEYLTVDEKQIDNFACAEGNGDLIRQLSALLLKYKHSGAKVIYNEIGEQYNMIFIETAVGVDIINCSTIDPYSSWDTSRKNAKLFDGIPNVAQNRLPLTVGNVEIVKSLLVANNVLRGSSRKLGNITVLQVNKPVGYSMTVANMKNCINTVIDFLGKDKIHLFLTDDKFIDPITNVFHMFCQFINSVNGFKQVGSKIKHSRLIHALEDSSRKLDLLDDLLSKKSTLSEIKQSVLTFTISDKIETLKWMRDQLRSEASALFNQDGTVSVVSPETLLAFSIEQAIGIYENREFSCESDIKKWSLGQGFAFSAPDNIPQESTQTIRRILERAYNKVGDRYVKFHNENLTLIEKLKQAKGYNTAQHLFVGNISSIYENLYDRSKENDLVLKNPWTDSSLIEEEKNYIKFALYSMIRRDFNRLNQYKWKSWRDLQESHLRPEDYNVPLMRARGMDKFKDPRGGVNFPTLRSLFEKTMAAGRDMVNTMSEQVEDRKKASDILGSVYNQFEHRTDSDLRKDLIDRAGDIKQFSGDLGTIMDTFTLASDMKQIYDREAVPEIKGALYYFAFQSFITGKKLSNVDEFIRSITKSNIYGDSIMSPEIQEYWKYVGPVKAFASNLVLGLKIANVPREMLMGMWTNVSRALFGAYGKDTFTLKDVVHALSIMSGDAPKFMVNTTKIEKLNELYRMANMSINELPEQTSANKTGIWALGSRWMGWALVAPDYWNRMSLFIAQMLRDGTWEAHELVKSQDGVLELKYDMSKDQRFDVFTKYKGDIERVPDNLKRKFNEQAALYEVMRQALNSELDEDIPTYKPGNIVPLSRAYTNDQRNSFKSFTDMAYGYYDRETKSWFFKTAVGGLFKMFLSYISAKKMSWWQTRSDVTARGEFKQLTDTSGNKIWRITLEDGTSKIVNDVELENEYSQYKNYAQPQLQWTGTFVEGILQSYIHLFKDLGIGSWEALRNGDTSTLKKLWEEYSKKGDIRHSNFLQGISDLLWSTLILVFLRWAFFDDPEVTGVSYKSQLKQSDPMFQNLYWITVQSTQDFSPFTWMKEVYTWESPLVNIASSTASNFMRALGDDDLSFTRAILTGTVQSVGMMQPIRPYMEQWNREAKNN